MVTDEEILNYFVCKNRNAIISARINRSNLQKNTPQYKEYLENRYSDFRGDYCEVVYRIANRIEKIPVCKKCGKLLKYHGFKENSYGTWCSTKCQLSDENFIKNREEKISEEKRKEILCKVKKTKLERYGNENFNNREKSKITCLEKYGSETYLSSNKRKEWDDELFKKTGKRAIINIDKIKETKFKKYGNANYVNIEKMKKTMIERYGAKTTLESKELSDKVKKTCIEKYGKEKYIDYNKVEETMLRKYGVKNAFQLKEVRDKIDYEKAINTKRKNGTLNSSKNENDLYNFLKETFPDKEIIRNYRDNRYKNSENGNLFCCDFYIKEMDLFIELNGHYTHGKHPFNINDDNDIILLESYKRKTNPSYAVFVDVWSHRDVLKFNAAKENKLNYFVIYGYNIDKGKIKEIIKTYETNNNGIITISNFKK